MLKLLKLSAFIFLIISMSGCASHKAHHHAAHMIHEQTEKVTETIKPFGIHEDCMELTPDKILYYSFESSNVLNFNIHYHNSEVSYPIVANNTSRENGSFRPKKRQYYCLMWINPHNETLNISYTYTLRQVQE